MPTERYANQEVNLVLVPVAYYTTTAGKQQILQAIINLEEVPIKLLEGTVMGHLQDLKEVARSIQTPSTHESICEIEVSPEEQDFLHEIMHDESKEQKKFITSPADIDTYRGNQTYGRGTSLRRIERNLRPCVSNTMMFSPRTPLIWGGVPF